MFNTFANVFSVDENNTKKMESNNPFDDLPSSTSTTDPFGISLNTMKLSESSEKFDDNPFLISTNNDKSVRPRSGKEALSSSNWLAYQHSMDEANLDQVDDFQDKSFITESNSTNNFNPFDISTISNTDQTNGTIFQSSPMDFLFDVNTDSNQVSTTTATTNSNQLSYDFLDFNPADTSISTKTENVNSLTDISKIESTTTSSSAQLTSSNEINTIQEPVSTGTYDDQFLGWLTQTADSISGTDLKQNKVTEDFGNIYPQLPTQQVNDQENNVSSSSSDVFSKQAISRPSVEEIPSIRIHEPKIGHNDSNIVPQGYFNKENQNQSDDDSDDEKKMVFKIGEKKHNVLNSDTNIPLPLLPPPPSPSSSKNYQKSNKDASSSSSDSDQDDPLAMFRTKTTKNKTDEQYGQNLITDWDEEIKVQERQEKVQSPPLDYYLHEPDYDDSAPLEAYHNDINELQLQQLNGWSLQIRLPLRQKDLYKSTFQRFSETRTWQECFVRIFFDEKKLRFYLPQTIEQSFAEIEFQTWYQCTKFNLQQYDQYSKIHTFKIYEANYREIPQVRIDRLVTLPEKLLRKFTRPNKTQQVLLDHANCVQQEVVKFGQLNYIYLKQFSIILDDLFWTMPVTRSRLQKHLKEEITVKILDEYYAHIDKYHHICKQKSRTRLFLLAFLNGTEPIVEIGMNDWFRHGKEVNKRNEIIINKTLQEYWIKPEQVELASIIDSNEYESTHLLKLIPPDSQKIEIMRFRTRPKQNIELPLKVYCFMSVINRQINIRIEITVSNAFNISILSKASSMATNDKTANIRDDNSDEQCPCENIQIRFPIPDPWVYMFRVEKRFRYGAIHSVRRKAGKIKGLDRLMIHRNDGATPFMAASAGIAKYEQAFRAIVWRVDQLPKRDQGAYKTHLFECKFSIPSHDPVPEKYEPIADVEYSMSQAFVSHCQIRSVAVPSAEETPEKWIRPKSQFTYTTDIEYAFKEEEKKEFAPIEIDMKEQIMSQSETENNSQSDDSD
ncbi:unnamed protein product [Adineta steineri]|uniref:Uncharacterized protein n=1 Tax=Adineta steineri TaxID=433720 RepID=A0A818ZBT9_9BILA|nr:unnamed protein product [Adineta steineri]CAF3766586.1 unnamed protein product [Adineta steineri]